MFAFLITIHVLVCIALVLVVLLQSGRGAELGAAFGGLGQATQTRGQGSLISKITNGLAAIFMITSLSLALWYRDIPTESIFSNPPVSEQGLPSTETNRGASAGSTEPSQESTPSPSQSSP